jgi:hypothetical protein
MQVKNHLTDATHCHNYKLKWLNDWTALKSGENQKVPVKTRITKGLPDNSQSTIFVDRVILEIFMKPNQLILSILISQTTTSPKN